MHERIRTPDGRYKKVVSDEERAQPWGRYGRASTVFVVDEDKIEPLPYASVTGWYVIPEAKKLHYFQSGQKVSMCDMRNWESHYQRRPTVAIEKLCRECLKERQRG